MKIYLAADHAGFALKELIKETLLGQNYDVEDCGSLSLDTHDDYPDFIGKAAEQVSHNLFDRAVVIGGSGQGEAMLANKYPGVRAAVFYGPKMPVSSVDVVGRESVDPYEMIQLARLHNDANVLSLAARFVSEEEALMAVKIFLETAFSEEERHKRRIAKIAEQEKEIHEYD